MNVLLPEPVSPIIPIFSPFLNSKLISSKMDLRYYCIGNVHLEILWIFSNDKALIRCLLMNFLFLSIIKITFKTVQVVFLDQEKYAP